MIPLQTSCSQHPSPGIPRDCIPFFGISRDCILIWLLSLFIAEGLDWVAFEDPFQPMLFCDFVILLPASSRIASLWTTQPGAVMMNQRGWGILQIPWERQNLP